MSLFSNKNKENNTFRFKSFGERVDEIDVRKAALYYIGHENEELNENEETYFHQTIKKWTVLNLTDEYNEFSKKCQNIVTLPQIIHKKDFIVDFLLDKLSTASTLSLQPLLEIIVVLSRDLREEFYPYFQRILDRLICLLNTQDADQLEWTLICLAFLFKALKPFLRKNIAVIFHSILPLLDEIRYSKQVTNFAVECFAFIARDTRDYDKLLKVVIKSVETESTQGIQGCGRLFFEIIRGINGQFHSISKDFLPFLFESLLNEIYNQILLNDIICSTVQNILSYIHPHNMSIFWTALCNATNKSINISSCGSATQNLLNFLCLSVQYKNGIFLIQLDTIVTCVLSILDTCESENTLKSTSLLISLILLSNNAKVSQLITSRLCKKILNVSHRSVFEKFIWSISDHAQFEILVFPEFLKFFEQFFDKQSLELMAKILLKKSPTSLNQHYEWQPYSVSFKRMETKEKLLKILEHFDINNCEEYIFTLIVIPHVQGLNLQFAVGPLQNSTEKICKFLKTIDNKENYLFILSIIIECLVNIKKEKQLSKDFCKTTIMDILEFCTEKKYIFGLKIFFLLLKACAQNNINLITFKFFEHIQLILTNNLFSPCQEVRKITSLIFNYFDKNLQLNGAYEIFFKVENIRPTVNTYREQLLLIHKLLPDGEFFKNIKHPKIKLDCLKFLLGILYYNFKMLWVPTSKLIKDFSSILNPQDFWDIYKFKLEETSDIINNEIPDPLKMSTNLCWKSEILNEEYGKNFEEYQKVDYNNYRNLLWSSLQDFGQISEIKNRDIVTLFLKFVKTEYKSIQDTKILTWNILLLSDAPNNMNNGLGNIEIDEEKNYENKLIPSKQKYPKIQPKNSKSMKSTVTTLCTKLLIFAKQINPKQMHREPELYAFYLDLLSCTNSQLQKLALDCILAYKNKSILPYAEHLYGLIDEKKFKDVLIQFKIHKESGTILLKHRKEFMPICLRILYGKMITKSSSKAMASQVRKGVILRFLGGCEKDEISWFLKMSFGLYEHFLNNKIENILSLVTKEFNLERVWSPKKLSNTINLLELIRKQFGGLMDSDFLIYMLKLIIFVGCVCQKVIDSSKKINKPKIVTVFKKVKTSALLSLVNFFQHFKDFEWTNEQINIITEIFVWPNIEKLPQDSIHSPTPLLKLLCAWSESYQQFNYFMQEDKSGTLIPFKFVINLLLNENSKFIVRKTILEMIERLLMIDEHLNETGKINLNSKGVMVVKPYIQEILKRIKMNFSQRRARRSLEKRDMNILNMLTQLVDEPETCDSLLQLLLPILISQSQISQSEEIINQIITTISNLITNLNQPETYVRKIGPLFEQIKEVIPRKMLCSLLIEISKKSCKRRPDLIETGNIINDLNAWDKRWIEQPDYDKRLDALKKVTIMLNERNNVNMDLGLLVIYNCFHFLKYEKDMGMRDNASEHLKILIPKLVDRYQDSRKEIEYLIVNVVLDFVRRTLRDKNDNLRNDGISLLGEISKHCTKSHQILQDLSLLADNDDSEVDFFENITNLQSYRHGKALLKFCGLARTLEETPNYKTLTQFMLPIATRYLLNEKFSVKHTLVDAAIETVGVICQLLPWHYYQTILKYYLKKMRYNHDHQKQSVRILVTILDAFHFDLSSAGDLDVKNLKSQLNIKKKKKIVTKKKDNINESDEENEKDDLDLELNKIEEDIEEEKFDSNQTNLKIVPIINKKTVLFSLSAKKVIQIIATSLIPTLNNSITEKSSYDSKHKLNRKRLSIEREEEEILRVPIALALVKLLQKLPKKILINSLPGVFMKVCTFLKSPLKSVRMLTRDILKKIMLTLGTSYLAMLLEQLTALLTRGFQVHVLSVTVHGVLDVLKENFQPGDIESCLMNILQVSLNDIFGEISSEKDVIKIGLHTPEAKPSSKSYLTLNIAARNISESCLLDILIPFKEYIIKSQSKKTIFKIQDCFQKIVNGLIENNNISRESLLIFVYGTISESIPDLFPGLQKANLTETDKRRMLRARPDCYIIQETPLSRCGAIRNNVKTNSQANAHVLIEFGLDMLHILLKRKKLNEIVYEPFLNPILPLIKDSLRSSHIRVTTLALKCFTAIWIGDYKLDQMKIILDEIIKELFQILHKYSTFGATKKDEHFHFVQSAFKAVVALLKNCKDCNVNSQHIIELLFYVDQDIYESDKQPMAFSLLKAIVHKKIVIQEIHEIMQKLCEISIISQSDFAREEALSIIIFYLTEYEIKKKIESILKYFITQLNFEIPNGRLSAIKFLKLFILKIPQKLLLGKAEFLYLTLGTRLVNEEIPKCRLDVAECIEHLIGRLDNETKQKLFDISLMFLENSEKPSVREMSAVLFSRFIVKEKEQFSVRVKLIFPVLVARLAKSNPTAPGRFVKSQNGHYEQEQDEIKNSHNNVAIDSYLEISKEEQKQKATDHELIQIQNCILKIFEFCPEFLKNNKNAFSTLDELAYESQKLLGYEHEWVRLNAIKILSILISNLDCCLIGNLLVKTCCADENLCNFIYWNPEGDLTSLILDLCAQMRPAETNEEIPAEIIKIFLFIANMLKNIPVNRLTTVKLIDHCKINMNWLLRRMRYIIHNEISKAPHCSVLRTSIFNWMEGLIAMLDVEMVEMLSNTLLTPLVREITQESQNIDSKLRQQAIRVSNKIRKKIGSDIYDKIRANIQKNLMIKRANRRKHFALEKVNDPLRAAKRKLGVANRKKLAKKIKMDVIRGKVQGKIKRKRKLDELF